MHNIHPAEVQAALETHRTLLKGHPLNQFEHAVRNILENLHEKNEQMKFLGLLPAVEGDPGLIQIYLDIHAPDCTCNEINKKGVSYFGIAMPTEDLAGMYKKVDKPRPPEGELIGKMEAVLIEWLGVERVING